MSGPIYLRFAGWATVRLPTDPDPTDEPRGASGFTVALAGEPDLDRQVRFQPEKEPDKLRPGFPHPWGVRVTEAFTVAAGVPKTVDGVVGAPVDLINGPCFENRNWLFTPPGWEPIVPFEIQVEVDGEHLQRRAPLTGDDQDPPTHEIPSPVLIAQGAHGICPEPETIGVATGIWSPRDVFTARVAALEALLESATDDLERLRLRVRLDRLGAELAQPSMATGAMLAVERFKFPIAGRDALVPKAGPLASADSQAPWTINYWFGAFDFDSFATWIQGVLIIPQTTLSAPITQG